MALNYKNGTELDVRCNPGFIETDGRINLTLVCTLGTWDPEPLPTCHLDNNTGTQANTSIPASSIPLLPASILSTSSVMFLAHRFSLYHLT